MNKTPHLKKKLFVRRICIGIRILPESFYFGSSQMFTSCNLIFKTLKKLLTNIFTYGIIIKWYGSINESTLYRTKKSHYGRFKVHREV